MSFILTINGGSSSVKFALFATGDASGAIQTASRQWSGSIQRIGLANGKLNVRSADGKTIADQTLKVDDQAQAAKIVIESLEKYAALKSIGAVGHRIVHGGPRYLAHAKITPEMLAELHQISAIDPDHLPGELALIDAFSKHMPNALQAACFDTAFHRDLPTVAKTLPIPQKYQEMGMRRYGFHGLSYSYLMEELARQAGSQAAQGRIILAHLGNGCSMAAVREGKCIDTTMSFTPTAGLVMGTRSGDLDPGAMVYLMRQQNMDADQIDRLINRESGLLGVSGVSSDMRDLLAQREKNSKAALAIDLFCYQAKKWIGALAAALGGLDRLVFSGGIGENSPPARSQICAGLSCLGIHLSDVRNAASAGIISTDESPTAVCVVPTDEEMMIARITQGLWQQQRVES